MKTTIKHLLLLSVLLILNCVFYKSISNGVNIYTLDPIFSIIISTICSWAICYVLKKQWNTYSPHTGKFKRFF